MKIEILKDHSSVQIPAYATPGAAGADLRAFLHPDTPQEIVIPSMGRAMIPIGLRMAIEEGFSVEFLPRSGLAIKNGITVINSPGLIDSDYRGPLNVLLVNLGDSDFTIRNGDRIAQMVVRAVIHPLFEETKSLDQTVRGEGGYGSTGIS